VELHQKRYGKQMDHEERQRKKNAREVKKKSAMAQKVPPRRLLRLKRALP
jgi:ribosome biogenesis protein NSA2